MQLLFSGVHVPPDPQMPLQHCELPVHAAPSVVQLGKEHTLLLHDKPLQQSDVWAHPPPSRRHVAPASGWKTPPSGMPPPLPESPPPVPPLSFPAPTSEPLEPSAPPEPPVPSDSVASAPPPELLELPPELLELELDPESWPGFVASRELLPSSLAPSMPPSRTDSLFEPHAATTNPRQQQNAQPKRFPMLAFRSLGALVRPQCLNSGRLRAPLNAQCRALP
jgi:hypothetical protein